MNPRYDITTVQRGSGILCIAIFTAVLLNSACSSPLFITNSPPNSDGTQTHMDNSSQNETALTNTKSKRYLATPRVQMLHGFFPAMPNGASCFRNLDCASGCCIIDCCFIGKCVMSARPGQVCGLLSVNPFGPPSYIFRGKVKASGLSHSQSHQPHSMDWRRRRKDMDRPQYAAGNRKIIV